MLARAVGEQAILDIFPAHEYNAIVLDGGCLTHPMTRQDRRESGEGSPFNHQKQHALPVIVSARMNLRISH
jgi:hypothetical protein